MHTFIHTSIHPYIHTYVHTYTVFEKAWNAPTTFSPAISTAPITLPIACVALSTTPPSSHTCSNAWWAGVALDGCLDAWIRTKTPEPPSCPLTKLPTYYPPPHLHTLHR